MSEVKEKWTAAQLQAMKLNNPLILVSAAAGSGKTTVLAERIIRRLTDPDHPADLSEMLIVTFTRSAAAELKVKIAKALGEAIARNPGDSRLSKQLLALGGAQISTIDSFFQKAVRDRFEQLELPASFRMAEESELADLSYDIMNDVVEEFYRKYTPESTETGAFSRLVGNRFADCMDQIFSGRSSGNPIGDLLSMIGSFSSYPDGIRLLDHAAAELREDAERDFLLSRAGAVLAGQIREDASDFIEALRDRREQLRLAEPDTYIKLAGTMDDDLEIAMALRSAADGDSWEELRAAVFSAAHPGSFPRLKPKPELAESYHEFRNDFFQKFKDFHKTVFAKSAVQLREEQLQTAEIAQIFYQLSAAYEERLLAAKKERGILAFDDVRDALYRLLEGEDGEETVRQLSERFREVYVDEYQDVNEIQDRIFSLIGKNQRFLVGDIKQSIYCFRGSDPTIFSRYRRSMPLSTEKGCEKSPSVCVFMSENFRCDQPIIDFANGVCSYLFSACEETVGYRPQDDLKKGKNDPSSGAAPEAVQVRVFGSGDQELHWVAEEIRRLLAEGKLDNGSPIRPSDIAVLARKNKALDQISSELESLGIPADKSEDLMHTGQMSRLLNLLHAIDNPYRDLPLSEYLLSESGGFSLEELSVIRDSAGPDKSLYDALVAVSLLSDHPLSAKAHALIDWLELYRGIAAVQPADRFLRKLYLDEKTRDRTNDPEYLYLYDQARIRQRTAWCGLYGFLISIDRMRDGRTKPKTGFREEEQSVKLSTIHGSKGLEYPVVFLVSTGKYFSDGPAEPPMRYHPRAGFGSRFYQKETGVNTSGVILSAVKSAIRQEETEEEIRLLYVALTRARERLYVTGALRAKYETLLRDASEIRRGYRSAILGAKSDLHWILAAMQNEPPEETVARLIPMPDDTDSAPEEQAEEQTAEAAMPAPVAKAPAEETPITRRFREIAETAAGFRYPLDRLRGIPTKVAASRFRPDLVDLLTEEDDSSIRNQIRLMKDANPDFDRFLAMRRQATAAEIGTATHAFLEFCDLEALPSRGIEAELDRLVREGFLTREVAQIVNQKQLQRFLQSDLMKKIRSAKQVYREQKFGFLHPLEELTADPELADAIRGNSLFVQGSIDLILETEDGKIELYDYKTDRIPDEERENRDLLLSHLSGQYANQLSCYARAVRRLFGKDPDGIYLYSLPLGESIPI